MNTYDEESQEEDRMWGRLMFDEVCEIRPSENLQLQRMGGVYFASVLRDNEWITVGMNMEAAIAMDHLIRFLGITEAEIEANAEARE